MGRRRIGLIGLAATLVLGSGISGCGGKVPVASRTCKNASECTAGEVCIDSTCKACRTTEECSAAPEYVAGFVCSSGRCESSDTCEAGTDGCPCLPSDSCATGLECVETVCAPACPVDTVREGSECRDAVGCEICDSRHRECVSEDLGDGRAECGDCVVGYEEIAGETACAPVPTCDLGRPGSIAELCTAQGRSCVPLAEGAECGPCLDGYVEVAGTCEGQVTCAELNCAEGNRLCETEPNGHCAGCVDDYVEEAGTCREVLTCTSAPCPADEICEEATATSDRSCHPEGECPEWQVLHRDGVRCVPCPVPCDQVVGSSGRMVETAFAGTQCVCETADGYFLSPGEDGGAVETVACDADGDGWVRDTLLGLQKFRDSNPEAAQLLLDNNRCVVRLAAAFSLRDEYGRVVSVQALEEPVPLLESSRNDDESELLALGTTDVDYLPEVGGTRRLHAAEINSLTKACLSAKADANHNGVPDVKEAHENNDDAYLELLESESPVGVALKDFTYFLELYDGFFTPTAEQPNDGWLVGGQTLGGKSHVGTYIIQERSRARGAAAATDAPGGIAMTYYANPDDEVETPEDNSAGNDHWRSCIRFRDAAYETRRLDNLPLHGLDFARFAAAPVLPDTITRAEAPPSLGHASQFKCILLDDNLANDSQNGYIYSHAQADSLALNQCVAATADVDSRQAHGEGNPGDPVLSCTRVDLTSQSWVGWGAVTYEQSGLDYERGCADEFAFFRAGCPGFSEATRDFVTGDGDIGNFGNLLCGCAASYGGPTCDYGCPDEALFLHPDYIDLGAAALYPLVARPPWLCATSAGSTMVGEPLFSTASGYTLSGDVPLTPGLAYPDTGSPLETPSTASGVFRLTSGFLTLRGPDQGE